MTVGAEPSTTVPSPPSSTIVCDASPEDSESRISAQRVAHLARVLEALGGVLGQRALHQAREAGREAGDVARHRLRLLLEHLHQDGVHRVGLERLPARQQLVEHRAQREHVGARVGALAADLLGRHVVRRAHDHPGLRHVRGARAREAEVHDLHAPGGQDVDVRRLQVAVDDALGVGEGEAVRDLLHDVELVPQVVQAPGADDLLEVHALEELHRHVEAALLLAEVEDGDDVQVVQAGGGLGLAAEPLHEVVVGGEHAGHRLDGDEPVEDGVPGLVDLAHGPLADAGDDLVLADAGQIHDSQKPLRFKAFPESGDHNTRPRPSLPRSRREPLVA